MCMDVRLVLVRSRQWISTRPHTPFRGGVDTGSASWMWDRQTHVRHLTGPPAHEHFVREGPRRVAEYVGMELAHGVTRRTHGHLRRCQVRVARGRVTRAHGHGHGALHALAHGVRGVRRIQLKCGEFTVARNRQH